MIENSGVAPIESFTMLGVSTARSNDAKIGQFGSGSKHGVLVLLRQATPPTIFCGKDRLTFSTLPKVMGGTPYNQVAYSLNGGKSKELSYSTEFGELDWKEETQMALREFVSNALDQSGPKEVRIDTMKAPRAKDGTTRVFVKLTDEVSQYMANISDHFLHFKKGDLSSKTLLPKTSEGKAKIYRKGVFVRSIHSGWNSLFDYNFQECKIDESRNMDDWACKSLAAQTIIKDVKAVRSVFLQFKKRDSSRFWEDGFSSWEVSTQISRPIIADAAESAFGSKEIPCGCSDFIIMSLMKKGYVPVPISEGWLTALRDAGVKTDVDVLTENEKKNREEFPAPPELVAVRDEIWDWFKELQLTYGKSVPEVVMFDENSTDGGSVTRGFYDPQTDKIYILRNAIKDREVMLEEISHYVSGAADETRDFQNFTFKMIDRMADLLFN